MSLNKASQPGTSIVSGAVTTHVFRACATDPAHQSTLNYGFYDAIKHEASVHDALFDGKNFDKVIHAAANGKIQAWFILASFRELGMRTAGVAVEFPSVYTLKKNNTLSFYPATYGEDTCVLPQIAKLFRQETVCAEYPKGLGLGSWFEHERIRIQSTEVEARPFGMNPRARIGEYFEENSAIIGMLRKFGTNLVPNTDTSVLMLGGPTPEMDVRLNVPVELAGFAVKSSEQILNSIFICSWKHETNGSQVVATFTEGLSTFTSDPVVQVQFATTGIQLPPEVLADVLASILKVGMQETNQRGWGKVSDFGTYKSLSPIIPTGGTKHEIRAALLRSSRAEIVERHCKSSPTWAAKSDRLNYHIHSFQEPSVVASLRRLGATIRLLGPHAMLPALMDYDEIPKDMLQFKLAVSTPLEVRPLGCFLYHELAA